MSSLLSTFLSLPMILVLPSVMIIDTASAADTLKGDTEVTHKITVDNDNSCRPSGVHEP